MLQLLVDSLGSLKKILENHTLHSEGFIGLKKRLDEEFGAGLEGDLKRILDEVAFFANEKEHRENISGSLKLSSSCSPTVGKQQLS